MIRAGLRPSSAMSTRSTSGELTPNSWCTSWAFLLGTATKTASPRAWLA
jgi:hypothetical protein